MAYLKLWIDPRIITSEQLQLPNKVAVGTNPDDSDKYSLTITRGDSLNSSTWAEEARFLLTPDPEIGHMPVRTDEGLKYLLVENEYVGYNNYWTYYASTKLWFNVLEDSYGKFIRFGSNIDEIQYWETLAQTYREDDQGNKDYYLFPECGINRGYGQYWRHSGTTFIRSMLERNFDTYQENPNVSYTNDNGERISRCPYTGVQEAIYVDTETEGGAVCITTRINIGIGSSVTLYSVATAGTANVINFTINRSEDNKYTITVPFPRHAGNVSGGTTREIPNFDPTIPHRYVFIHRPDKVLEVWVDHVQYKKEDGSDIYYQKSGVYDSYDWTSYIWGYNKAYSNGNPVEDLYEFKLYQGELKYEDTIDLTAYITASRNPVTTNVPSLSTSELTCHAEGLLDRNLEKYNFKYIKAEELGHYDFSQFPPVWVAPPGRVTYPSNDTIKDSISTHLGTLGSEFIQENINGTDYLTIKYPYFIAVGSGMYTQPSCPYPHYIKFNLKLSNIGAATSKGNRYFPLNYWGQEGNAENGKHFCIYPIGNNKFKIINQPNINHSTKFIISEQEFEDLGKEHTYEIYAEYKERNGVHNYYVLLKFYVDGVKVDFKYYNPDAPIDMSNTVYLDDEKNFYTASLQPWNYGLFSIIHGYTTQADFTYSNFYAYTLVENPDYEEYPELTYLWNTGETTKQITVQPTEPTIYSCTVTQGTRTANASILIDTTLERNKPIAVISPQEKPYIEHMIGRFYATNSYDINDPVSPIVKYIWNDVETISPIFVTRVKRTDKIRLRVVNALGLVSDEVEVDLSKDTDQWGNKYKFLDIPMFLICSKGANLFDTLISRFPIPSSTLDLYSNFYPTEYDKYTSIGFTTDISTDTIRYMACLPHHGVAEYTANREQVDIYPLGISWLEKRNMIKYYNKVKGSKGSLMACIGHPELQEEGYGSLEFVLDALGIITPKERYTIPRLLDLLELLLMDYDNGGLIKL